ncbi:RNI-like protein [Coccomyxa subellipsoidea C-169]|uniref:RNI-like protein n=1 Tax=Coccomyxa subellipsoidea (strain C-169) TaxID=574566 RepID=I0Z771_COCSC|nr:RNI-like protein [Coccomyxa subellipsoidea C-169]EIE26490.1 RNI-like protein [Coccomyxa subellipsoidea C-169]|eukprot:XP_005651034.1 RNI-like protein [Coccomyxa subellipsoidea C-169]
MQEVKDLCSALENNTRLNDFTATSHSLSVEDAEQFAGVLRSNSTLQSLSLGTSSFGNEALSALSGGLSGNTGLQKLDLHSKGVGAPGLRALQQAIAAGTGLDHLTLSGNSLGDEGAAAVAAAIPFIREVDLHDCEIGASGARSFAAAFEDARDALEAEASGGVASNAEINGRAAGPARKIRLQVLRLDGNPLGFSGTSALKPLLSQLKELHLGRAALGDEGAASLAAAMPSSSPLELLDVNDNDIGPTGAAALAEALERGLQLKVLRMRGNRIGDEGAAALGRALAKGPLLQELDVGGNQMGTGAAELLGSAQKLRKLSLFDSHLGDEGACVVADRLSAASFVQLMELELSACRIGTVGMVRLFDVLESQAAPALEMLVIGGGNPALEEDGFQGRVEALRAARPELDVAWRAGDSSSVQQLGGAPVVDLDAELREA